MAHKRIVDGNCLKIMDDSGLAQLSIQEILEEHVVTLKLSGSITMSLAHDFEDELTSVATICNHIIIDFSGVDSISSAGLDALLYVQKIFDCQSNSKLKLRSISSPVQKIFHELGFDALFEIEDEGD